MLELLRKIERLVNALSKLIPVIIDVLNDLSDDGKRNFSNTGKTSQFASRTDSGQEP